MLGGVEGKGFYQLMDDLPSMLKVGRAFGDECVEEMVAGRRDTIEASMAKVWGSESQCRVVDERLQLFGVAGYLSEYIISRV